MRTVFIWPHWPEPLQLGQIETCPRFLSDNCAGPRQNQYIPFLFSPQLLVLTCWGTGLEEMGVASLVDMVCVQDV